MSANIYFMFRGAGLQSVLDNPIAAGSDTALHILPPFCATDSAWIVIHIQCLLIKSCTHFWQKHVVTIPKRLSWYAFVHIVGRVAESWAYHQYFAGVCAGLWLLYINSVSLSDIDRSPVRQVDRPNESPLVERLSRMILAVTATPIPATLFRTKIP
jgi:hypothetical protein